MASPAHPSLRRGASHSAVLFRLIRPLNFPEKKVIMNERNTIDTHALLGKGPSLTRRADAVLVTARRDNTRITYGDLQAARAAQSLTELNSVKKTGGNPLEWLKAFKSMHAMPEITKQFRLLAYCAYHPQAVDRPADGAILELFETIRRSMTDADRTKFRCTPLPDCHAVEISLPGADEDTLTMRLEPPPVAKEVTESLRRAESHALSGEEIEALLPADQFGRMLAYGMDQYQKPLVARLAAMSTYKSLLDALYPLPHPDQELTPFTPLKTATTELEERKEPEPPLSDNEDTGGLPTNLNLPGPPSRFGLSEQDPDHLWVSAEYDGPFKFAASFIVSRETVVCLRAFEMPREHGHELDRMDEKAHWLKHR